MLRFCVAVAGSYSSKWTPSLGTSYAMGKVLKRQKKKKKKKETEVWRNTQMAARQPTHFAVPTPWSPAVCSLGWDGNL